MLEPMTARLEQRRTILVVDDEAPHRASLEKIFQRAGFDVFAAADGQQALEILRHEPIDVILSDLVMPKKDGRALLQDVQQDFKTTPFILMTAYGTIDHAVEAMRLGAHDFLTKPVRRGEVLHTVEKALEHKSLREENERLQQALNDLRLHVGTEASLNADMRAIEHALSNAAPTIAPLLFTGESGTGKEVHARKAHMLSDRKTQPFIALNCAALPENLLEAELFGVEKGAYTGADKTRLGRFERAQGGTLFLDEIGDMPLSMQAKMLRVLQDGQFERVGGQQPLQADVRLMCATNKDLDALIKAGLFREDLFYRINMFHFHLPPLDERKEDIPNIVQQLSQAYQKKYGREFELDSGAMRYLMHMKYPGNIRELQNILERAAILSQDGLISQSMLSGQQDDAVGPPITGQSIQIPIGLTMSDIEHIIIEKTLDAYDGDKNKVAQVLGIGLRTLYRKLNEQKSDGTLFKDV